MKRPWEMKNRRKVICFKKPWKCQNKLEVLILVYLDKMLKDAVGVPMNIFCDSNLRMKVSL